MNNSLHGSNSSNDGTDDAFINDNPDGMENYVEDILFPMLDEGSLDHAILESLFYNEISLMNSSNSSMNESNAQSDILSPSAYDTDAFGLTPEHSASDGKTKIHGHSYVPQQQDATGGSGINIGLPPNISQNGNVQFATLNQETEIDSLRNFGVGLSNVANTATNGIGTVPTDAVSLFADPYPQGVGSSIGISSSQPLVQLQTSSPRKLSVQLPKHTLVTGGGIRHNVLPVIDKNDAERTELPPTATTPSTAESTIKIPTNPTSPTAEEKKRKKLISQFATLAGRLGITLPPQVFQKLTGQVADANQREVASNMTLVPDPIPIASLPNVLSPIDTKPPVIEPQLEMASEQQIVPSARQPVLLQQAQKSAVEAIAAVTSKRSNAGAGVSTAADNGDSPMDSNKPYSKKRKKPRLSDCEQKLAELQSENMILKRHLDNIANRNARLDEDRMKAEKQMREMLQDNAPDSILDPIVKNFTDMYSDYGRKRHDELNFHLQQLQRLANPTNFTKMGLWTLGGGGVQSSSASSSESANGGSNKANGTNGSKNPIAGMLQRELGISAQQGRKILDQRQKIQNVCSNLKECLKLLAKLNQLCEKKTQMFHNRMTKCQQVLTPKQVVKLLIWIDDNSQTLGTVCPGWGSEQFQSKSTTTKKDAVPK